MTTDTLQERQLKLRARLTDTKGLRSSYTPRSNGIELTRMENFVDGGYDIFDVLEHHAANKQMKIKIPAASEDIHDDIRHSSLFKSLLSRLKEQMKEMVH